MKKRKLRVTNWQFALAETLCNLSCMCYILDIDGMELLVQLRVTKD